MTQNSIDNTASIFDVDNLRLDGNTIISTDTNGNIVIAPDGTGDIVTGTTGTANVVSMLRSAEGQWFDMNDQTDVFGIYNSTGTPEGGITANIGSLCTDTTNGDLYIKETDSANTGWVEVGGGGGGIVVQITQSESTTAVSSTTSIPVDDTIPSITQGASYMTHAHTALNSANILKIEFFSWGEVQATRTVAAAIYEQPDTNALACITYLGDESTEAGPSHGGCYLFAVQAAGSTDATTYEIRFGGDTTANTTMNGERVAAHRYGAAGIATLRITEYTP